MKGILMPQERSRSVAALKTVTTNKSDKIDIPARMTNTYRILSETQPVIFRLVNFLRAA
ncbi:MAG: hypothetical protein AAF755_07900 [Pseudomonadota bacterium]